MEMMIMAKGIKSGNDLVADIMAYEMGELTDIEQVKFFSRLVKNGLAFSLQGSYGRTAKAMMVSGLMDKEGNILIDLSEYE